MYTYHEQRHLLRKITVSQALPAPRSSCKVSSDAVLMLLCRLQHFPSDGNSVLRASFADAVIAPFLAAPSPGYVLRSHCPERSGCPCIAPEQHKPPSYYRPPTSSPVYQCPEASRSSEIYLANHTRAETLSPLCASNTASLLVYGEFRPPQW